MCCGSYRSLSMTSCAPCAAGTFSLQPGSVVCDRCDALASCGTGQYHLGCGGASQGTCTPCSSTPDWYYVDTSIALLSDSCPTQACSELAPCATGYYRLNCGGTSLGTCIPCTNKAVVEYYTSHGGLADSCPTATCQYLQCVAGSVRTGACGNDATGSNNDYACEQCAAGRIDL